MRVYEHLDWIYSAMKTIVEKQKTEFDATEASGIAETFGIKFNSAKC